jgi:hypothetical protein
LDKRAYLLGDKFRDIYKTYSYKDSTISRSLFGISLAYLKVLWIPSQYSNIFSTALSYILEETYKKLSLQGVSIGIAFDRIDMQAIESMRNNFYWMRSEFNDKFQSRLMNITQKVFEGEIPRAQMAAKLKEEFSNELKMDMSYFEGVSDHIISQSQNIARVNQARKYDAPFYKVVAIMDSKTSDICRSMNGRVIPAEHLERQANAITAAKSMAAKKAAATWRNEPYLGRSDKMDASFGLPPYHFRCRTEVVPVWVDEYEIEGVKMKATQAPGKDEVLRHIDKTGVERILDSKAANGEHGLKYRLQKDGNLRQDIIKALNSIVAIAPKKGEANKMNAISQNGYFLVFDGVRLVTAYKHDDIKEYFKKQSVTLKQEIIKRWWQE